MPSVAARNVNADNPDTGLARAKLTRFSSLRDSVWLVGMFSGMWIGIGVSSYLAVAGIAPLWASCLANIAFFYYLPHLNHEAIHRNVSGANSSLRPLNEIIGRLGSFPFLLSFDAFRTVHLTHHRHTNDPELDSDMWVARRHPVAAFFACITLYNRYEFQLWKLYRRGLAERRVLVQFYAERLLAAALIATAFVYGYGLEAVLLWLVPALIQLPLLGYLFAYLVHRPHDETDPYRSSNVILAPRWLQPFVTAAFGFQNYHLIHHLNPRIPFFRYGEAFRELRPELEQKNAAIAKLSM